MSTAQGSLLSQIGPDTGWRACDSLPHLDNRYKRLSFDSEWTGTNWHGEDRAVGYSFCLEDRRKFYLPFGHKGGGNLDKGFVLRWMNENLRGKELVVLGGKGDIQMARKDGVDLEANGCTIREVQYKAALLSDQRRSFTMDAMAFDFLGRRKAEIDRARIWELPAYEVGPYAEQDAVDTLDLDDALAPKIREEDLGRVLDLEDSLIYCVCEMERNGVPLNVELLNSWRTQTRKRFEQIVLMLSEATGLKINPNSGHDLATLFGLLQIDYPRTEATEKFPNGQPSFTDEFLQTVRHELAALIREGRSVDSLHSKYFNKYWKGLLNGILYYQLHQLKGDEHYGTISGRFSSSSFDKGRIGANIQQVFDRERQAEKMGYQEAVNSKDYSQVPWLVRNLFEPAPGKLWLKADASQIEFRFFVHYSRSSRLIRTFTDFPDTDFHQQVADLCSIRRKPAKNINFGKLFGMGRDKMARELGLGRTESDVLFSAYDEKFPETRDLMNEIMGVAKKRGYVKDIMGRRARFPNGERLHSATNRVIQGSAATYLKRKAKILYDLRHALEILMRFVVHDEFDMDVPSPEHAAKVKAVLDEPLDDLKIRVPLPWDVKVGPNWGACS